MSVVGFDFGTQNSRIAVVRARGVDVICNEVSDRATPSMVSFDTKRRYAGDPSRTQQVGNFRNTVVNLPRLLGRLADEPAIMEVEALYETCRMGEKEGVVAAMASYRGEDVVFSNTELVGMFLNKLKAITLAETKQPVSDVVISVPAYFTEKERRALMDAAEVAGLNCLRTVNDTTAAAVNYGLMKTENSADTPKTVIILDIGYASLKACLASFVKEKVEIKAHVFDMHLGGRDFDEVLVKYFSEHFLKTRKVDIRENKKALLRLRLACERIKKVLSGNQVTRLDLEALVDEADFTLEAKRALLEELSAPLLDRIEARLRELLQLTGVSAENVDSVEIIGGTTRIPAVKVRIAQIFGKDASTTLNADEAVSRGCALLCAMDSPLVRVRECKVVDVVNFPVKLVSYTTDGHSLGEAELFSQGAAINEPRSVSLELPQSSVFPVVVEAHYSDPVSLPRGTPSQIAKFTICAPKGLALCGKNTLVIDASFSTSSVIDVVKAHLEIESLTTPTVSVDQATEGLEADSSTKLQPQTSKTNLTVKVETFRIPRQTMQKMKDTEISMTINDTLVAEIDDRRNAVEEFIYEARAKMDNTYSSICTQDEIDSVLNTLSQAEEWLYGDGADLGKDDYTKKLDQLRELIRPFAVRLTEQAKLSSLSLPENQESVIVDESEPAAIPAMDMD